MEDIFSRYGIAAPDDKVLLLAPMEGVTNEIFRELVLKYSSADLVATEFIRITSERQRVKPFPTHRVPLQIQIMGKDEEMIVGSLAFLKSEGVLSNESWLDLNVGCPSKKVTSKGAGSALLLEPKKLLSLVEKIRLAHPGPLSIKTRIGFQRAEEYPEILSYLKDAPLDFISVHGRTKCGQYSEPVNHRALKRAVDTLPFPVIGNGDIWTVSDALEMISATGVRGVMCGRGVIRDPFLLGDIRRRLREGESYRAEDPIHRQGELIGLYVELLGIYQELVSAKRNYVGLIKEFSVWFSRNPLIGREFFDTIKRLQSLREIREVSERYFEKLRRRDASSLEMIDSIPSPAVTTAL